MMLWSSSFSKSTIGAYTMGAGAIWAIVGYTVVEFFQFIYIGRRLRTQTQALGAITLLDYFESRFADSKHLLRITGAVIIGIFITAYVSAQFYAGAKTLSSALDIQLAVCLLISGLLILIYMVLGGFVAVAYNDVVRAVIMLIGLVVLPVVGLVKMGTPQLPFFLDKCQFFSREKPLPDQFPGSIFILFLQAISQKGTIIAGCQILPVQIDDGIQMILQIFDQGFRQRNGTVFFPFPVMNGQNAVVKVQIIDPKVHAFEKTQTAAI